MFTTVQGTCRKTCQCYAIGYLNVQEYHGDDATDADELAVKVLRSDNGGEYLGNDFKRYLSENGIHHQLTVAYTPQQNGVAERMNRTLLDLVCNMLEPCYITNHCQNTSGLKHSLLLCMYVCTQPCHLALSAFEHHPLSCVVRKNS